MNKPFRLDNQTALVTGAGSGLGREFARILAGAGANVVVAARRMPKLQETADIVSRDTGGEVYCLGLDVNEASSITAAFDSAEEHFGVVDIVVNNAGISRLGFLMQLGEDDWDAVVDTNLKAAWMVAREGAKRMKAAGVAGSIINIASILAFGTGKMLGAYMVSKAGVVQLTRSMALEWSLDNIRVNAIAPGYFSTEMNEGFLGTAKGKEMLAGVPMRRAGESGELEGPLLLLASGSSSYMTGSVITVDGGHLCRTL